MLSLGYYCKTDTTPQLLQFHLKIHIMANKIFLPRPVILYSRLTCPDTGEIVYEGNKRVIKATSDDLCFYLDDLIQRLHDFDSLELTLRFRPIINELSLF